MKRTSIDFSEERLLSIASDMIDDHNFIGALKMLNKNAVLNDESEESHMLYAEAFDDMGLYEKSINSWFAYLNDTFSNDVSEAYEGLAMCYMNIGNEHFAAYYYNKLLLETDELTKESREEIIRSFVKKDDSPLRFAYPPSLADYSGVMREGVDFMRANDYEKAIKTFEKVDEENEKHSAARNYIAMCKIITDKYDEAEQECLNILRKHPDDVQAITTLAAVKTEQKKTEESRALAEKLISLNVTATEDIYKIATVCCENKMHEEAYALFCKLENELKYDSSVLYFKAVSAYNCGKVEESFEAFDKLITIYPDAVTADYYYNLVRGDEEMGIHEELSYFYRLPQEEREQTLKFLAAFHRLSKKEIAAFCRSVDISFCVKWCFDEGGFRDNDELKFLAATCAVRAQLDDYVRKLLLNAFLPDTLKVHILAELAERNIGGIYGVVVCNMYNCVDMMPLEVGRTKRRIFISAYAILVSRFAVLDDGYCLKFNRAAKKLYEILDECGSLYCVREPKSLAAAIYALSGIREAGITEKNLCEFFGANAYYTDRLLAFTRDE